MAMSRPAKSDALSTRFAAAFVALVALVVSCRALANGLVADDVVILDHPLIQSWKTLPASLAAPWWSATNHLYRPLTLLSFGIERGFAGTSIVLPHAVNIALQAGVTLLLFRLLARFASPRGAALGALAFAVLPVHAEAISTIVGRAELLSAAAMLGAMLLVTSDTPPSRVRRFAVGLLSAAALASKEVGIAAPVLIVAAAWMKPETRKHVAVWAASALIGTLALLAARIVVLGTIGGDAANPVFRGIAPVQRILIALAMLPRSAAMLFLPIAPAIDFVPAASEIAHPNWTSVSVGLLIAFAVLALMLLHVRRPNLTTLGACIVAATAAPTANLLFASGVVLDGRTLYAPSIGGAFMIAGAIDGVGSLGVRRLANLGAAVLAMACAVVSWNGMPVWRSNDTMVAAMLKRHPEDYRGYMHLAYASRDAGNDEQSLIHFREAAARFRRDPEMLTDAATVALRVSDTTTARDWLAEALEANPRANRARTRLVGVLRARGDIAGARALLLAGLVLEPDQREWRAMLETTTISGASSVNGERSKFP
jgi:hypothetical protein